MNNITISTKDQLVMSLVHFFVTKENYSPIVVKGAKDEIWLENLNGPYKIIRINTKYIHNDEQMEFDLLKIKHVLKQIKRKTLTFKMNALNICLDVADRVGEKDMKNVDTVNISTIDDVKENESLKVLFPLINTDLIQNDNDLDLFLNVTNDVNKKTEIENKRFNDIFKEKKIIMTYLLMGICILMFLITVIFGEGANDIYTLLYYGGNNIELVKAGQIYRLITSTFLHAGVIHLFVNMYSLYIIGKQLENFIGKWKFLGVYLISAVTGSLLSLVLNDAVVSVGASGALFGLLGAIIYFGFNYRLYFNDALRTQIIPILVLNLSLGFFVSGIDVAAHFGGLIGGYLSAIAFGIEGKNIKSEMIKGSIAVLVFCAFLIVLIYR